MRFNHGYVVIIAAAANPTKIVERLNCNKHINPVTKFMVKKASAHRNGTGLFMRTRGRLFVRATRPSKGRSTISL
jgi:hypothetical protein